MPAPLALSALASAALVTALGYGVWSFGSPGPGLMPAIGAGLMLVASLAALRSLPADQPAVTSRSASVAAYIAGFVALVPVTVLIGLLPALGVFATAILRVSGRMSWLRAATVALLAVTGSALLFEWALSVPLPHGALWGR